MAIASSAPATAPATSSTLPQVPPLPWRTGLWVTLAALAWIAMGELDRLSSQVPDPLGRVLGFTDLMGLAASSQGWAALDDSLIPGTIGAWLLIYLGLDVVLIACYLRLGVWLWHRWPWVGRWLAILALVDLAEDLLAARVAGRLLADEGASSVLAEVLMWVTRAKFVLLGLVVASFVQQLIRRRRDTASRESDRSLGRGLYAQRFSLLTVLPVALLSVIPASDILDQLPDVQRQWAEGAALERGVAASFVLVVLAAGLFLLGRLRSDYVAAKRTDSSGPTPISRPHLSLSRLRFWLVPAGILLVLAAAAQLLGAGVIQGWSLFLFAAVPTAVAGASGLIRWLRRPPRRPEAPPPRNAVWRRCVAVRNFLRTLTPPAKRPSTYADFRWVCLVGDVAATTMLAIGGLGLVRSFVAPAALADLAEITLNPAYLVALAVGAAVALGVWWPAYRIMKAVTLSKPPPGHTKRVRSTLTPGAANWIGPKAHSVVAAASVLLVLTVACLPQLLAQWGGVTVTTLASIGALSMLIGSLVVLGQSRYSPELFWLPGIRLRSAPVASLLVAAVIVTAGTQVDIDVHPVRGAGLDQVSAGASMGKQIGPDQALQDWINATSACGRRIDVQGREVVLRPMPLVAAEGGGIRAAYWTAAGLDLLSGRAGIAADGSWQHQAGIDPCRTALFSGGASGGAVGLTVSRFAEATPARDQLVAISRSDALAKAVDGLFIRDTFYAATGVPLPALPGPSGWSDRAALMEQSWERAAPALGQSFLPADGAGATSRPTGVLLLNSTSVATGCRMFVSQLSLRTLTANGGPAANTASSLTADANAPARATCDDTARPAPNSIDLLATYSRLGATGDGPNPNDVPANGTSAADVPQTGCLQSLRSSTAALLASRFPYVTPSGVIGPCGKWPRQQFVDGGYVENTGISTIIDLAPWWLEQVRKRNEQELRAAGPIELIVPFVVYLDNGTGSDLAAPTYENTSEFLVPPLTILRSFDGQTDTAALLQQAASLVDADRLWNPEAVPTGLAGELNAELEEWRPRPVLVIHQPTVPAVTAPLGWTLSNLSIDTMDRSLAQQVSLDCAPTSPDLLCRRGYGSLADANRLFSR